MSDPDKRRRPRRKAAKAKAKKAEAMLSGVFCGWDDLELEPLRVRIDDCRSIGLERVLLLREMGRNRQDA
jgi:hypothetical protein